MKAGVHLANDGNVTDDHLSMIRDLPIVKGLVRLDVDWDEIDYTRLSWHLRDDCDVVLRLFFPGRLDAPEFVERAARKLPPVLNVLSPRQCYIEIHNEPNHAEGIEGWGASNDDANDFLVWYNDVFDGLRERGFRRLGFPGLAVGEWVHRERTWATLCRRAINRSDWLGIHVYWQRRVEMKHDALGENWKWYRRTFPRKRIIVTEAGNSSCQSPGLGSLAPGEQAAQYASWCSTNPRVYGVTFFLLGGSHDWDGFAIGRETIQALRLYNFT